MSPRRLFIVNPVSGAGKGRDRWASYKAQLVATGIAGTESFSAFPGQARQLARDAVGRYDLVVAVGGDGTAYEVVSGMLEAGQPPPVLALIPTGTGNDAAAALGVQNPPDAIEALVNGQPRPTDVIHVDCLNAGQRQESHALLFAAVGIVSECLEQTTPMVKRLFGHRLAYVVGLLRALMSYRAPRIRVSSGDQQWEDRFLFVCASNAETSGGGMRIAPGARVDDGLLNLNFIDAVGRLQAVRHLAQLFRGEHVTHPRVRYFPATELSIDADQPLAVAIDGDLAGSTPARFTVKPGALKIVRLRR